MHWKTLSFLNKEKIQELQDKKLKSFIRYQIRPYHPYYRKIFKEKGIDPYSIKTTADLKKIPFTTKEDLAPTKDNPKKHLDFILQPNEELIKKHYNKKRLIIYSLKNIIKKNYLKNKIEQEYKPMHIHFTTGRTALAVPFLYSSYDIQQLKEAGSRLFDVFDIKKDAIAINAFPYSPHLAFWQTFYAIQAYNILSLQSGGGKILGTEKIINALEKMKANVITATPGYAYHLIRKAAEEKRNLSKLKNIIFGGERVSPGLRDKINDIIGDKKRILATYAFTEGKAAWGECTEESGYHLYPDMEFVEIVDDNGEQAEKGHVVYTALDWRASTVLRYKTGDIGSISYEKCANCGRTVPRIAPKIERKSEYKELNLTKVKGTLVNLNFFIPFMMGHKEIDEWQVEIKKRNNDPYEVDELILFIAPKKGIDMAKLKTDLWHKIRDEMEIAPEIVVLNRKELLDKLGMETELKEKRILDRR